ncbi:MAG: PQQ-dependent sugar dehydrogenase [Deltaproteobacteria bacterium]
MPSAIAFIPNPGKKPKDPLYFVTELRGRVKVVTNDRTIYTFSEDFFKLKPSEELPALAGELGLAGICLDPASGYVFVTFAYQDANNILRNNIVRFQSKPGIFSLKPASMLSFTEVFSRDQSSPSHQIGGCQIYDDLLYVSVGNGYDNIKSQSIDSTLGKVLRMTLDGKPLPDNPFYVDNDIKKARNYVWAYGFRNPFGLKVLKDRVFVVENGKDADKFLEVQEGENYLWDGTDWSIGINSAAVFAPAVGPVQMDYYKENLDIFPEKFKGKFYVALSGTTGKAGPDLDGGKSIIMLDYSLNESRMLSVPKHFLKYIGSGLQIVVGVGLGPDGLYFVPLMPDSVGRSSVFKVIYDKNKAHPYLLNEFTTAPALMADKGCFRCHTLYEYGFGTLGPALDRDPMISRIEERLDSQEYAESVKKLDLLEEEPYLNFREARKEVLEKKGIDKVRIWIKYHLLEPKFDNPRSQMPNLGLSEHEAVLITDHLVPEESLRVKIRRLLRQLIPRLTYKYMLYSFIVGFVFSFLLISLLLAVTYRFYRKRR